MSYGVGGTGSVPEAGTFVAPVPGTRIYLRRSEIKGKQPAYGDAEFGELFVNYHSEDPMLCFKDNAGNIVALKPAGPIGNGPMPPGSGNETGDLWWDGNNLLVWNGGSWEVVGEQALGDLTDVDTTDAADGMVLAYNGTNWVPVDPAGIAIDVDLDYTPAPDKGTVTNTAGDDAEIPLANGTNAGLSLHNYSKDDKDKVDAIPATGVPEVLGDLGDVDTAGEANGNVLAYDGSEWVPVSPASLSVDVDLDYTPAADKGTVTNTAGDDAEIPFATSAQAGLFNEAPTPDTGSVQYAREVNDAGVAAWAEIDIPPGTIVDDGTGLPADLSDGQLWFNTTDETLYVYLADTDEWKPASPGGAGDSLWIKPDATTNLVPATSGDDILLTASATEADDERIIFRGNDDLEVAISGPNADIPAGGGYAMVLPPESPIQGDVLTVSEWVDGSKTASLAWRPAVAPEALPPDLQITAGTADIDKWPTLTVCGNLIIDDSVELSPKTSMIEFMCYGDVTIGNGVKFDLLGAGCEGAKVGRSSGAALQGSNGGGNGYGQVSHGGKATAWSSYSPGSGASGAKNDSSNQGSRSCPPGGDAGGSVIIKCTGSMTIGTATFDCRGQSASSAYSAGGGSDVFRGGGGGGGAGGAIVLQSKGEMQLNGTVLNADGGVGRNGIVHSNSSGTKYSTAGGGGGGGGYIIFGSALGALTADTSTMSVDGAASGVASLDGSGTPVAAGGGGGNGGKGGDSNKTDSPETTSEDGSIQNLYIASL